MEEKQYFKRNNGSERVIEVVGQHESGDYLCKWLFSEGEPFRYHHFDFEMEFEAIDASELDTIERQYCPRRVEGPFVGNNVENPDYWAQHPNGDKTCSYCGSLHPDSVLAIVAEHGIDALEFSTKSYKWYIHRPAVKNAMEGGIKYYRQHDTKEFVDKLLELINTK